MLGVARQADSQRDKLNRVYGPIWSSQLPASFSLSLFLSVICAARCNVLCRQWDKQIIKNAIEITRLLLYRLALVQARLMYSIENWNWPKLCTCACVSGKYGFVVVGQAPAVGCTQAGRSEPRHITLWDKPYWKLLSIGLEISNVLFHLVLMS